MKYCDDETDRDCCPNYRGGHCELLDVALELVAPKTMRDVMTLNWGYKMACQEKVRQSRRKSFRLQKREDAPEHLARLAKFRSIMEKK